MYRVLICDDEEMEIKSLIATVDWAGNGFEICGTASDGISALEAITRLKPQLVFTDIRMPGFNGLELIKKARLCHTQPLFVVISGYAEFSYVQKAINCGAVGYCLKPFEDDELQEVIETAKRYIDAGSATAEAELLALIAERDSADTVRIADWMERLGMPWNPACGVTALASAGGGLEPYLSGISYIRLRLRHDKTVYLAYSADADGAVRKLRMARELPAKSVGVSDPCRKIENLYGCIREASLAADQPFMTGANGIYWACDVRQANIKMIVGRLRSAVESRNGEKIARFFQTAEDSLSSGQYGVLHACKFYNLVMFVARHLNVERWDLIDSPEGLTERFRDVGQMTRYLSRLLTKPSVPETDGTGSRIKNETFRSIVRYVNQNFNLDQLSLQAIACRFTINSNYVSQLFKKEMGVTFTEYLSGLRLNCAAELLETTELPVCTVAEKSGFNDYFYFARVFKKFTGKTPSFYRQVSRNSAGFRIPADAAAVK